MKMAISFFAGIMVCTILMFGARTVMPILAADDLEDASENTSQGLLDLLPDIERIYKKSLTMPFVEAESKIYDEDIAEYYGKLLDETGLRPTDTE